jgi:hypothetical protein
LGFQDAGQFDFIREFLVKPMFGCAEVLAIECEAPFAGERDGFDCESSEGQAESQQQQRKEFDFHGAAKTARDVFGDCFENDRSPAGSQGNLKSKTVYSAGLFFRKSCGILVAR